MRPTPVHIDQNAAFRRAMTALQEGKRHVFITGKAGTGKSTLLDYFMLHTANKAVVLAPTGVAALNVRGQTIHRFFNFYIDVTVEQIRAKKHRPRNIKLLGKLQTIIIDEVSMVRADLLDCIDETLRLYGPVPGTPFGGVQMVLVGDLYQLPPVVGREEAEIFNTHYSSPYFFSARALADLDLDIIELDKVYRQKDTEFVALLNRVRNNAATPADLDRLNERVITPTIMPDQTSSAALTVTLTTTNAAADSVNTDHLAALPGRTYLSVAEISGDFTKDYYPTAVDLTFKIGAQIMMLNNDSKNRWVNGTMGVVTDFKTDEDGNDYVEARLEGDHDTVTIYPFLWEVFKFKLIEGQIASEAIGTFGQYPFRLAWAVTIHKSQGKTFERVVVDLGRGTFASGQIYVALSRCTSFEGLFLKRPVKASDIKVGHQIGHFLTAKDYRAAHAAQSIDEKTALIARAIKEQTPLRLTYLKPNEERSTRVVDPLSLGDETYKGHAFIGLRAFCRERQEGRVFRVDRILLLEVMVEERAAPKAKRL